MGPESRKPAVVDHRVLLCHVALTNMTNHYHYQKHETLKLELGCAGFGSSCIDMKGLIST